MSSSFVFMTPCASCPDFAATTASPNPASSELVVTSGADDGSSFEASLFDSFGKKVKTQRGLHGKALFDVRDLPAGLYYMRTGQGKAAHSERIQVTH